MGLAGVQTHSEASHNGRTLFFLLNFKNLQNG